MPGSSSVLPWAIAGERLGEIFREDNSLLPLDEPTSHLDAASIQMLQEALERWPGGMAIATHDARFAESTTTQEWTLAGGTLLQGAVEG